MSKKIKIIISVIIIFLIFLVGGIFYWWQWRKETEVGFIWANKFTERNLDGEKIIEDKKSGLSVRIPKEWKKIEGVGGLSIIFLSPDFELHPKMGPYSPPVPQRGCSIEMSVKKEIPFSDYDIEYSYLQKEIDRCLKSTECEDEVIEVNGHKGSKHIFYPEDQSTFTGNSISIKVPSNDWVYTFNTYLFSQDREKCTQEFDKFLENILLK